MALIKTFFFLRILESFSYIVTMMMQVLVDLRVFILFYAVLILMFGAAMTVLGPNDADEYKNLNKFLGNFITAMRLSLGDLDFGVLDDKSESGGNSLDPS